MRWSGRQVEDGGAAVAPGPVRVPGVVDALFPGAGARSVRDRAPGAVPVPQRRAGAPSRGRPPAGGHRPGGDTRVLMADGTTRPLAELAVGDAVVGTRDDGDGRRYVRTTVQAHRSTRRRAVRVRLADGTVLTASGEHRFLTERGWRYVAGGWCRRGRRPRLRPGDVLLGPGRAATAPADASPPATPGYRSGYLCGVVRGDGAGPAEPDRCFPSVHLELEALGRAHHYLAGLPAVAMRRDAGVTPATDRQPAEQRAAGRPPSAAHPSAALPGRSTRPAPRRGCGAVVDGRIPPPWESAARRAPAGPAASPTPAAAAAWPAEAGEDWCAGFLAGVVDARGRVTAGVLRIRHADEEVVGRVAGALHRLGFGFVMEPPARGERTVALAGGAGELVRLVRVTGPAVRREVAGGPVAAATAVVAVEESGREEDLHDITTDTGDLVAGGVVGHDRSTRRGRG